MLSKKSSAMYPVAAIAVLLLGMISPSAYAFIANPSLDFFPATSGAPNITAAHMMRMSMDPSTGQMMMDPNGMLMQHHNNGFNPTNAPTSTFTAGVTVSESGGTIDITVPNWTNLTETGKRMQVQVLSFLDPSNPGAGNIASDIEITSPSGVTEGGIQTFFNVADRGMMWDAIVQDFSLSSAPASESLRISTNGANIGQVYVFTTTVPVPAAVWLFGSGILGIFATKRRRQQHELALATA